MNRSWRDQEDAVLHESWVCCMTLV
jgi:hypothetical protein